MKKILLIFCFLFFTLFSFSQEQFNKTYDNLDQPVLRNVVIQDTNYVAVGGAYSQTKVIVNIFSKSGSLIQIKEYGNDSIGWYHGVENSLKETNTGNYILGGTRSENYFRDNLLVKFDDNFDTIFTKKYYPVDDNGYKDVLIFGSNIDIDGGYLLVGQTNIDNNYDSLAYYNMQLIKTDTLGNLLWRKVYGNSTYKYYGYKVTPAFDGGYILGGWSSKNGGDNCIIKTDENGENPIYKYFGHPSYGDGRVIGITPTKDSCYIISASKEVTSSGLNKAHIFKLDKNLNIIWDKLYLNIGTASFFVNAFEKENGNLIVHGNEKNSEGRQMMVIMELTSEGDSLWKQTTTSYDTLTTNNYLENGKLTPDGGMIFAGWTTCQYLVPFQQMWLVKTDSLGCDGTQWTCNTTYLENLSEKADNGLIVYPNPANNILHITIKNVQLSASVKDSKSSIKNGVMGIENIQTSEHPTDKQFNNLTIDKKLKYSSKNPNNKFWGKKEEQEMRELSHKLAYAFPFEVIKGKVDIFSIDPALKANLIARNEAQISKQSVDKVGEVFATKNNLKDAKYLTKTEVRIYDIFGHCVITSYSEAISTNNNQITIDVSNLQKGVYFVKIDEYSAKFVKE